MHEHLEIIMPNTNDVEDKVKEVMMPFSETEYETFLPFWDFYFIGGRFSGQKLIQQFNQERINEFVAELQRREITISGFQAGKEELKPADQIPMVDRLWRSYFPESPLQVCPLFKHFNNQYTHSTMWPDVMKLDDTPGNISASRMIIATPCILGESKLEARTMVQDECWNGVNHLKTIWDGTLNDALAIHENRIKMMKEEPRQKQTPQNDWLIVTVDYHH